MLILTGTLGRAAYVWRSVLSVALMAATILLFPYLLEAIVSVTHCGADACGALGLVVASILRPILFLTTMIMVLSTCIRRARDAGLHPWLGAFPPLMFVGDQAFLQYAGAGWAYSFSAGILSTNLPFYALFGMVLIILLAVPRHGSLQGGSTRLLDRALLALAALLSIGATMHAGGLSVFTFATNLPVKFAVAMLVSRVIYAMPLFVTLASYRLWRSALDAPGMPAPFLVASPKIPSRWLSRRAVIVGAMIALAVLIWSLLTNSQAPFPLMLVGLITLLLPFFLPTFLIYTALVASVMRLIAKPDVAAAALLIVALIPFGIWTASLSSVLSAKARERLEIGDLPKVMLPTNVSTVVIEGDDWSRINCARGRVLSGEYGLGEVLTRGQSKSPYLRFTFATAKSPLNKGEMVDSAPSDYVLIRFPRRPAFFQDRVSTDIASPPIEIYAVSSSGTHLVATNYVALNPAPTFPPMLTTYGWYRGDNSTTFVKSCKNVAEFLERELLNKLTLGHG